jgi:hypothetical protein
VLYSNHIFEFMIIMMFDGGESSGRSVAAGNLLADPPFLCLTPIRRACPSAPNQTTCALWR